MFSQNFAGGEILKFSKYEISISQSGKAKLFAKVEQATVSFLDLDLSDANVSGDRRERP